MHNRIHTLITGMYIVLCNRRKLKLFGVNGPGPREARNLWSGEDGGGGGRLDDGDHVEQGLFHDTFVMDSQFNE